MRNVRAFIISIAAAEMIVAISLVAGSARDTSAAAGDSLRSFDAAVPACTGGTGTGMAFDGTQIYLSCWSSNVLERVSPADGSSLGPVTISSMWDIGALTYDLNRHTLWACSGGYDVWLMDLGTLTATWQFSTQGCAAGLAYDPADDTLWTSCNVCTVIQHYSTTGTPLGPAGGYDVTGKLGASGSTGLAVGSAHLYVANDGGMQVYDCSKDLSTCALVVNALNGTDDLECDDVTFAPKTAVWSQNAFSRTLTAWEVDAGTCDGPVPGVIPAATATATATATDTPVPANTATSTATATVTSTFTATATSTRTATSTSTPKPATATRTSTATKTSTRTATATATPRPANCLTVQQKFDLFVGILMRYGAKRGQAGYDARYDLNNDGTINASDALVLLTIPTCHSHGGGGDDE